jgi:hypothetical protein
VKSDIIIIGFISGKFMMFCGVKVGWKVAFTIGYNPSSPSLCTSR